MGSLAPKRGGFDLKGVCSWKAVAAVCVLGCLLPSTAAAKEPKPTISSFKSTPSSLPSAGGAATITASVAHATSCQLSSNKTVTGLPVTAACSGGSVEESITFPENTAKTAATYKLTLQATGAGGSAKTTISVTVAAYVPPPKPTIKELVSSPPGIAPEGGGATITANVAHATSCKLSSNKAVGGLPATVECSDGTVEQSVSFAANTGKKAVTYTLTLEATGAGGSTKETRSVTVYRACTFPPYADLKECGLQEADLEGADLEGSDLQDASLEDADLRDSNLKGSDLRGADLDGAELEEVRSGAITGTPVLPEEWSLVDGYLIGPHADLVGADLKGADLKFTDLEGVNLAGADLEEVRSGGITGTPSALPAHWELISGYLVGPSAHLVNANLNEAGLEGADLAGADLESATLKSADVEGADVAGADLASAALEEVRSGGITGAPSALPANWKLVGGYLAGPNADLEGAELESADLEGADLKGANLHLADLAGADLNTADLKTANLSSADLNGANLKAADLERVDLNGTDLAGADLDEVVSGHITGTPESLPEHWELAEGYLVGPGINLEGAEREGANLKGADLEGANAKGANLASSDLEDANLSDADLEGADLQGADLEGADVSGVNWTGATCPDGTHASEHGSSCEGHL